MEPVSTTVAISTVVGYLTKTLKENKTVSEFIADFTSATVNWIRPIFLKEDDTPKDVLADLKADPESKYNATAAENAIAKAADGKPEVEEELRKMYAEIQQKADKGGLGDSFHQTMTTHGPGSDNIGRDKNVYGKL